MDDLCGEKDDELLETAMQLTRRTIFSDGRVEIVTCWCGWGVSTPVPDKFEALEEHFYFNGGWRKHFEDWVAEAYGKPKRSKMEWIVQSPAQELPNLPGESIQGDAGADGQTLPTRSQ